MILILTTTNTVPIFVKVGLNDEKNIVLQNN